MYRFVVIGFGNIGKRHSQEIAAHPEAELVAIVDIDPKQEVAAKELYPSVSFFNSPEAFYLSNLEVDVVNVCTPNSLHPVHSLQALNFYSHVVCEKPMAIDSANCQQMIDLAKEVDRKVFVVMQNRYSPPAEWLKEVVDSGKLGKIFLVKINCFWNRDHRYYTPDGWRGTLEYDGGVLYTQFSHFVDLLYWLFGDIKNIQASFENFSHQDSTEFEDTGIVSFDFEQGGKGSFNYSTCSFEKNLESSITIIAEKGTIKIDGQYMNQVSHCEIENYTMPELPPANKPNLYAGYEGSASNHIYVIDNVIKTLKGEASETTNAEEGMKVVDMIERMYQQRDLSKLKLS